MLNPRHESSYEAFAEHIGFELGNSDDTHQASLVNGFSRGFMNSMDKMSRDSQACYLADKLSPESIKFIKLLHAFVEIKEENSLADT